MSRESDAANAKAMGEASFKSKPDPERVQHADQDERLAVAEKTARLRGQRLAKEEADRIVAEQTPKPPPKKKKSVKPALKKTP